MYEPVATLPPWCEVSRASGVSLGAPTYLAVGFGRGSFSAQPQAVEALESPGAGGDYVASASFSRNNELMSDWEETCRARATLVILPTMSSSTATR